MARYEHLPIYRKTFELALHLEKVTAGFSRRHRYSLGTRLQVAAGELLGGVVRAQNADPQRRTLVLEDLRIEVEVLKNLLHLAKEVQAFKSFGAYGRASDLAAEHGALLGLAIVGFRPGQWRRCRFIQRSLPLFVSRALAAGLEVTVARETGRKGPQVLERRIVVRFSANAERLQGKGCVA